MLLTRASCASIHHVRSIHFGHIKASHRVEIIESISKARYPHLAANLVEAMAKTGRSSLRRISLLTFPPSHKTIG